LRFDKEFWQEHQTSNITHQKPTTTLFHSSPQESGSYFIHSTHDIKICGHDCDDGAGCSDAMPWFVPLDRSHRQDCVGYIYIQTVCFTNERNINKVKVALCNCWCNIRD
jgi:hypothetical protein